MRSVDLGSLLLLSVLAACGGSDNTNTTGTGSAEAAGSAASTGTAATSGSGTAPKAGTSGSTTNTGAAMAAAGKSGSSAAPTSGAGSSGNAATSPTAAGAPAAAAGNGGAAGGGAPTMAMGNIECEGKAWPPRAQGGYGPFPVGPESAGLPPYWPTSDWKMEDPAKLGFNPDKLKTAIEYTTGGSSNQAVLVIRHGYIAAEEYYGAFTQSTQHESFSVAKSFTSGLIGIAIGEGKIPSLDAKICEYYPEQWDCSDTMDPRSRITIDHALNLKTGLTWNENWRSDAPLGNDGITTSLDGVLARESAEEPGVRQRYSTGDPALMSGIIQKATGMTALAYAQEKIFKVIGTTGIRWNSDPQGRTTTFAGMQATAREYAKYGYLYLNYGKWDGQQIVPEDYVRKTTQATMPCTDWVQYLWHVNLPTRLGVQPDDCPQMFCQPTEYVDLPQDGFFAEGVQGQFVFVIPSADLVVVRFAQDGFMSAELWDDYARGFLLALLDAIN